MYVLVLAPYGKREQERIEMRPAQWSQLQSLIRLSKMSSSASGTAPGMGNTVSVLDDMELQKIRASLSSRGLKPNLLRLTADNPPRLEIQISDAIFSVWLDALEELRTTWRLYPDQMSVIATGGSGMVNTSASLMQHEAQKVFAK
jgi:type II secretory pathway component PulM